MDGWYDRLISNWPSRPYRLHNNADIERKEEENIRYLAIGLIGIVVSFILIMIGAVGSFGKPRSPSSTVAPSTSTCMLS